MDIEKIQISHDVSEKKRYNQKWEHGLWLCSFFFLFFYSHKVAGCLLRVFRCEMGASGAKMIKNLKFHENFDKYQLFGADNQLPAAGGPPRAQHLWYTRVLHPDKIRDAYLASNLL